MQLKISKDGSMKIIRLCHKNGFFTLKSFKNAETYVQYGPLGSLLTRNIWKEWLFSILNNVDVNMFPIEITKTRSQSKLSARTPSSYLTDVFNNYLKTRPFMRTDITCGFAAYGSCLGNDQATVSSEVLCNSPILRKLVSRYGLCVVFFCPFKKSSDWFNYWARYRYRWWRKLSGIPSKFSMSDVTETQTGDQQISLLMEFPWGKESLETVTLHKEDSFRNICRTMDLRSLDLDLAAVVCESELNLAAFAYLNNSFAEKWRDGEMRKLLQLHTKLAPYKVCICIRSDTSEDFKSLVEVAKHLVKELKKCGVVIYPYWDSSEKVKASHFSRYDEMGIPYAIVLDAKALHSGIAHLRNRDTTLEEQVHIAELTSKLLQYLQMKSFDVDKS